MKAGFFFCAKRRPGGYTDFLSFNPISPAAASRWPVAAGPITEPEPTTTLPCGFAFLQTFLRDCLLGLHKSPQSGHSELVVNCLVLGWVAVPLCQSLGEDLGENYSCGRDCGERCKER